MSKCIGCGITLQNNDSKKIGYTKNLCNKYCERCFKTIHYNEEKKVPSIDNLKIINKINKLGYTTFFITDLFSINKKLIEIFKSINNKKILVINKCDIIPKNLKLEHIEENIKKVFKLDNDIFFISAKKNMYLNKIINIIESDKNIIFCGETSSGKSTLINNLIGSRLTTSKYNNTTLDFIKLKYLEYNLYDSPGIIINENKMVVDNIKVLTKKLNDNYVLKINDLQIKLNGNVTLFISEDTLVSSKKCDGLLENKISIEKSSDIELPNGFIFVKDKCLIHCNKELSVRSSIISK